MSFIFNLKLVSPSQHGDIHALAPRIDPEPISWRDVFSVPSNVPSWLKSSMPSEYVRFLTDQRSGN